MALSTNSTASYVIVEFPMKKRNLKKQNRQVEILVKSWTFINDKGELRCYYPNEIDYSKVDDWTREQRPYDSKWNNFEIIKLQDANNYDQAKRRLARLCASGKVDCSNAETDAETTNKHKIIENLQDIENISSDKLASRLNKIPKFSNESKILKDRSLFDNNDVHSATKSVDAGENYSSDTDDNIFSDSSFSAVKKLKKLQNRAHLKRKVEEIQDDSDSSVSSEPSSSKRKLQHRKINAVSNSNRILSKKADAGENDSTIQKEETLKNITLQNIILPLEKLLGNDGKTFIAELLGELEERMKKHSENEYSDVSKPSSEENNDPHIINLASDINGVESEKAVTEKYNLEIKKDEPLNNNASKHAQLLLQNVLGVDVKTFIEEQLSKLKTDLENSFDKKIENLYRRLHYDQNKIKKEILDVVVMIQRSTSINDSNVEGLPYDNVEKFKEFDLKIKDDTKIKEDMKSYVFRQITSTDNFKSAIKVLMPKLLKKEVQLQYSGKGRVTNENSKLNFSETNTYTCIKDVIFFKFKDVQENCIIQEIGKWLTLAGDREGGRCERKSKTKNSSPEKLNDDNGNPKENV